jgi:hypothetical protein
MKVRIIPLQGGGKRTDIIAKKLVRRDSAVVDPRLGRYLTATMANWRG